jgi:cellulose synthase (UDP-forming)
LGLRYIIWRSCCTLYFSHWSSQLFSITVFTLEIYNLIYVILLEVTSIWSTESKRKKQADLYQISVKSGQYLPSVDIFIPTYDESESILRKTIVGCLEINYPNKQIHILDDTRRSEVQKLAIDLGCNYITRSDNLHRKAGNLNNALKKTKGELIVCFDADFVPFSNFLERTVGFFKDGSISMLQTKQGFYNYDCHAKNLNIFGLVPGDMDFFFDYVQPCRDAANSVICCGTSYIVRRSAIESVGGYYTRCCVEDFQTSSLLLSKKHKIVYLNEMLSRGEVTRTYPDFIDQRLRWLQGILQVYYCTDDIKIWQSYDWGQRVYALVQLMYCFQPFVLVSFLLTPLISLYFGINFMAAEITSVIFYYFPFFLMQIVIISWATNYSMSFFGKYIQDLILAFPSISRVAQVIVSPFRKATRVTRKGIKTNDFTLNLYLTYPLLMVLLLSICIFLIKIIGYLNHMWDFRDSEIMSFMWIAFNILIVTIALLSTIDRPERRSNDRFSINAKCNLFIDGQQVDGCIENLSLTGALINVYMRKNIVGQEVGISIYDANIFVEGKVIWQKITNQIGVEFTNVSSKIYRDLVKFLYCQYQDWMETPKFSSIDYLLIFLSSLFRFKL